MHGAIQTMLMMEQTMLMQEIAKKIDSTTESMKGGKTLTPSKKPPYLALSAIDEEDEERLDTQSTAESK